MDLTSAEQAIKAQLDAIVAKASFRYNPDEAVVTRVIKGTSKSRNWSRRSPIPGMERTGSTRPIRTRASVKDTKAGRW